MPIPSDSRVIPAVEYLDATPVSDPTPLHMATPAVDSGAVPTDWNAVNYATDASPLISAENLGNFSVMDLVQMFVVYAFIIAAGLSAVFIFVGGISFILSGGNEEKITKAVNTIRYSIVGLIVTILSFTFVTIVGRVFGLDFLDYLSYSQIKTSISQLVSSAKQQSQNSPFPGPGGQ
jgi:glucose uptake protein GlcU